MKNNGKHESSSGWKRRQKRDDVFARLLAGLPIDGDKKQKKNKDDNK